MRRAVIWSSRFKKDYRLAKKRNMKIELLDEIINCLAEDKPLPYNSKDHALTGNWAGFRECHIKDDWILVYQLSNGSLILTLMATGKHSEVLGV